MMRILRGSPGTVVLGQLFIALLVGGLVVNVLLKLLSPPDYRETVLDQALEMLAGNGGDDSWGVMHVALEHHAVTPAVPLYSELFFNRHYRFQYPPSSLFALMGLRLAGPQNVRIADGMNFGLLPPVNDLVGWLFLAATAAASGLILETRLRRQSEFEDRRGLALLRTMLVFALALVFYPLVKAYTLGQIQVWINGLIALALLAWLQRRTALSGVLAGLACLIKPHYGLLVVWALLRRDWPFVSAAVAVLAVGVTASVAIFGWANHVDYLGVLQFLGQHGEAYYPNQSVNGLMNRLMALSNPAQFIVLDIPAGKFPPYSLLVYGATLLSSIALLLYGLFRRGSPQDRTRDFARMILCCTMASPIAWEHHYGVLFPIFAFLLADLPRAHWRIAAIAGAYLLAANFFPAINLLALTPLNPALSYVFIAALTVLVLLHSSERTVASGR